MQLSKSTNQTSDELSLQDSESVEKPHPLKGKNILIVEDVMSNYKLLEAFLSSTGANLFHEEYGKSAIETFISRGDIDLVLLDIRLPDGSGIDVVTKIRELNSKVIIIAQTAFAMFSDRIFCLNAGCNEYLSKPIKRRDFNEVIAKFF